MKTFDQPNHWAQMVNESHHLDKHVLKKKVEKKKNQIMCIFKIAECNVFLCPNNVSKPKL